jgi:hypothetical protein
MEDFLADRQTAFVLARKQFETPGDFSRQGVWATALDGKPRSLKGRGVEIIHANAFVAEQVAATMEYHLPRIAEHLGLDGRTLSPPPVAVVLYPNRQSYGRNERAGDGEPGQTRVRYVNGKLTELQISVYQRDPGLLNATIPHELTHLLLAAAFNDRLLPAAIEEGLALHIEPTYRHMQFRGIIRRQFVSPTGQPIVPDLRAMLRYKANPAEDAVRFYAASYAWISFLASRGPASKIVATAGEAQDSSDLRVWAAAYGFANPDALQQAFAESFAAMAGQPAATSPSHSQSPAR